MANTAKIRDIRSKMLACVTKWRTEPQIVGNVYWTGLLENFALDITNALEEPEGGTHAAAAHAPSNGGACHDLTPEQLEQAKAQLEAQSRDAEARFAAGLPTVDAPKRTI